VSSTAGGLRAVEAAGGRAFAGFELHLLARTPSTQDVVRAAARAGAAEGWCCVAAEQTAGRGRQGRRWQAPAGSALLTSVLLRPRAAVAGGVPLAVGVAVADAVAAVAGVEVGLKWPNDVLAADGGKLAGVLVEVEPGARELAVVAGVGINLRVDKFPPGVSGASLHRLAPEISHPPARRKAADRACRDVGWDGMLAALLTAMGARMRQLDAGGVAATAAAWRERAVGLGRTVRVETPAGPVAGVATDIADDGALLVATTGGEVRVLAGDVHLVAG